MTTLFVNACIRGEESRTLGLCWEYLAGKSDIIEADLEVLHLTPLDKAAVNYRLVRQLAGEWSDPIFDLAHQFAKADEVVIGAPYWDLSFPAALKTYIEHVSVCDITFHYTEDARCLGLCRAKSLTYITTAGGSLEGANYGYDYICGIARMFGIPETRLIAAECLDVVGIDEQAQLEEAYAAIRELKRLP